MSKAWVCPKCGRVWGPLVMECSKCNKKQIAFPDRYAPHSITRGASR